MNSSELIKMSKNLDTPLIVHDSNSDENFVIMGVDSYKRLKQNDSNSAQNKTRKKDVLDKINKNISLLIKQQKNNKQNLRAKVLKEEIDDDIKSEDNERLQQALKKDSRKEEAESKIEYDSINEDTNEPDWSEDEIEIEEVESDPTTKDRKNVPKQDVS